MLFKSSIRWFVFVLMTTQFGPTIWLWHYCGNTIYKLTKRLSHKECKCPLINRNHIPYLKPVHLWQKKDIDRLSNVRCRLVGEEWQGVAGCAIKLLILAARSRLPPINTGSNLARPRHLTLSTVYLWIWRPSHHRPHAVKGVSKISPWFWNIRRRPYLKKACLNTFLCAKALSSYSSWLYSCLYRYRI